MKPANRQVSIRVKTSINVSHLLVNMNSDMAKMRDDRLFRIRLDRDNINPERTCF